MKPMPPNNRSTEESTRQEEERPTSACKCVQDPFADLPPELQPRKKSWKTGFRQVICLACGLEYWTNCEGDLCVDCQKRGAKTHSTQA